MILVNYMYFRILAKLYILLLYDYIDFLCFYILLLCNNIFCIFLFYSYLECLEEKIFVIFLVFFVVGSCLFLVGLLVNRDWVIF